MGDIQQILQTSWPILLMVVIFYFLLVFMAKLLNLMMKKSRYRYLKKLN